MLTMAHVMSATETSGRLGLNHEVVGAVVGVVVAARSAEASRPLPIHAHTRLCEPQCWDIAVVRIDPAANPVLKTAHYTRATASRLERARPPVRCRQRAA